MIGIESPDDQSGVGQSVAAVAPGVVSRSRVTSLESFLRFVVVVAGIILGAILALIVGLMTGWIPFNC